MAFSPLVFVLATVLLLAPLAACVGGGGGNAGGGSGTPTTQSYPGDTASATRSADWYAGYRATGTPETVTTAEGEEVPLDGRGYTVAVVDIGFKEAKHENLHGGPAGRRLDVTPVDTDDEDVDHGVSVAGVIGAQGGGNFPKGVAPGASLLMYYPSQVREEWYSPVSTRLIPSPTNSSTKTLRKPYVDNLYARWKEERADVQAYLEENRGKVDDKDTKENLEKTLRGEFFKTEEITSGVDQGKYQYTKELKDRLKSDGAQPLVSVNYSYFNAGMGTARRVLTQSIASDYCHKTANYSLFLARANSNRFPINPVTKKRTTNPHGIKNYVCGDPESLEINPSNAMPAYIFVRMMRFNPTFRTYMHNYMDDLDEVIQADEADEAARHQVHRDLVYDLGKEGVVTVAILGNFGLWGKHDGNGQTKPRFFSGDYPAALADEDRDFYPTGDQRNEDLRTYMLTVGALEGPFEEGFDTFEKVNAQKSKWKIADYSHGCGGTKERCLFVPLHFYRNFVKDPNTGSITNWIWQGFPVLNASDTGVGWYTGTSFAAPVVSGSVALLVQYFKPSMPNYNGVTAAQRLLDTTYALGDCRYDKIARVTVADNVIVTGKECREATRDVSGSQERIYELDEQFGNGLLDLKAALTQIVQSPSSQGVAGAAGDWASVPKMHRRGSVLALSMPFGDAATRLRSVLNSAIVIDDLGHAHRYALGSMVGSGTGTQIDSLLFAAPAAQSFSIDRELIGDKTISLAFSQNTTPEVSYIEGNAQKKLFASGAPTESFTNLLADSPTLSIAYGDTGTGTGIGTGTKGKFSSLFRLSYSDSALTGESRDRHTPDEERGEQQLIRLSGEHRLAKLHGNKPSTRLRWQAALLREDSETLGGANRGVYGLNHGAKTRAFSIGADQPLANGLTLSADITSAKIGAGQGGLIARWDSVRAQGWALSLTHSATDSKTLTGLRLSQPLRTSSGVMDLSYPARYFHEENRVEFDTARVGLRPSGRELRLELTQSRTITPWFDLESRLLYRHQPNHLQAAPAEYGASLGIRIRF